MKFKLTYRQYDLFVDVLFYLNIVILGTFVAQFLGWRPQSEAETLRWDFVAIMALELLVKIGSFVAIFWRALRDEYAERLWQKSAATFAKIVLFLPWVYMLVTLVLFLIGRPLNSWLPSDPLQSIFPRLPFDQPKFIKVSIHELDGIHETIGYIWKYAPFLFISLYKWHHWRDQE
jgi:hypothetical protein